MPRGLLTVMAGLLLSGCVQTATPASFFELSPDSARNKALQTRLFETTNEKELLSASAAVLQDLGFQIEESDVGVGMLRAAKERSARQAGQEILQGLILALGLLGQQVILMPVDLHQQIGAVLATHRDEQAPTRFMVRILFYRTVWKGDGESGRQYIPPGQQWMEVINDQDIYRQFFAKLSKGLFLEAQQI
ncbi:MAG TPA: hypothetical protein VLY45_05645 [Nitrospiria bacterium]|nr:hypothetical protein [Nitrospiria bacterium]